MYEQQLFQRRNHSIFVFRHAPPLMERSPVEDVSLGKRPKPPYKDAPGWQCSVFYYWWRFVREHPGIRAQVESGTLKPGTVAYDFRRAFSMDFRSWWEADGRYLFCEPREQGMRVEAPPFLSSDLQDRVLISIPFKGDLEQALAELRQLLKPVMADFKEGHGVSRAKYPVVAKPVLSSLEKHYRYLSLRNDAIPRSHAEMADAMGLQIPGDPDDPAVKMVKSATVIRYRSQADCLLEHVGKGLFPITNRKQVDKIKAPQILNSVEVLDRHMKSGSP